MPGKIKVLFLCTGNSCRSQMAEGWTRHLKGDIIEAHSAGIETHCACQGPMGPRDIRSIHLKNKQLHLEPLYAA